MSAVPRPDSRTVADVEEELVARAHAWLPDWQFDELQGDPGHALLGIAARMCGEVINRLNRTPEKQQRAFVDWLGVGPLPPYAASMPVVFQLAPQATAVTAPARTRLQASLDQPVIFETRTDVRVVPGNIAALIGVDPAGDRYFSPSSQLLGAGAPTGSQTQWTTLAAADYPASTVQLSSSAGLAVGQILSFAGVQCRIAALQANMVTLEPALQAPAGATATAFPAGSVVTLVQSFAPFADSSLADQQHSLLIGDNSLLAINGAAQIDIVPAAGSLSGVQWSYYGLDSTGNGPTWQLLGAASPIADGITLSKGAGALSTFKINGRESLWLRGTLPGSSPGAVELPPFGLRVRSGPGGAPACPDSAKLPAARLQYTAFYNNTQLDTSSNYLPLGPLPKLFDSLYVACVEAFSKAAARVTLCCKAGPGATVRMAAWSTGGRVFGVSEDGRLQRIAVDEAAGKVSFLQPTQPEQSDAQEARGSGSGSLIALTALAGSPPVIQTGPHSAAVIVAARNQVWSWTERLQSTGYWTLLGSLRDPIDSLVVLSVAGALRIVALADGQLRYFDTRLDQPQYTVDWTKLPPPVDAAGKEKRIQAIAAVRDEIGSDATPQGMIAVSADGQLHHRKANRWNAVEGFGHEVDPSVIPLAVALGGKTLYVVSLGGKQQVAAWRAGSRRAPTTVAGIPLWGFEPFFSSSGRPADGAGDRIDDITIAFQTRLPDGRSCTAWWQPLSTVASNIVFRADPPDGPRGVAGTPVVMNGLLVSSGVDADIFVSKLIPDARYSLTSDKLFQVAVTDKTEGPLAEGDFLTWSGEKGSAVIAFVTGVGSVSDSQLIARLSDKVQRPDSVTAVRRLQRRSDPWVAATSRPRTLSLQPADAAINAGDLLMLAPNIESAVGDLRLFGVVSAESRDGKRIIVVNRDLSEDVPAQVVVWRVEESRPVTAFIRPAFAVPDAAGRSAIDHGAVYAADAEPPRQNILFSSLDPSVAVLRDNWIRAPSQKVVLDAVVNLPSESMSPASGAPTLLWEYWNGSGWWKLDVEDSTDNLLRTGTVSFYSPADLSQTTVAGKKDYWIRARLVAGDYGQEIVSVATRPDADGKGTTSTVIRDDSGINPPYLEYLDITYRLCTAQSPAYVMTYDNGSYNDQSEANRAASNSVVTAFVPLADAVGSAGGGSNSASENGPALFIGFSAQPDVGPISLLWDVADSDFSALLPLDVAAVGPNGTPTKLNSGDSTRALGESGVLTVNLPFPLTQVSLFNQSRYWLRLTPTGAGAWSPSINAVYLNGVMADAAQTQELEVLGSSIGEPNATFQLLQVPVLAGSLELRVNEALSDSQQAALRAEGGQVRSDLANMPGNWVLWEPVGHSTDFGPDDRVYSVDPASGRVIFGDGLHGRVPPVGRNNIVAFQYERGGGSAANAFAPWGSLSLSSPVRGVSGVMAPQAAAGGADATAPAVVLSIAPGEIRQRGRAITLRDLEQLALQSSPDIVQARSWRTRGRVSLTCLTNAANVVPSIAQRRALKSFLQSSSTPGLSSVLDIVAPSIVRTRVSISAGVLNFDLVAQVTAQITAILQGLFDPQTGGVDGGGWPLGRGVMSDDVAAALLNVSGLVAVSSITIEQVDDAGAIAPMPAEFSAAQYPLLATDGIRLTLQAVGS